MTEPKIAKGILKNSMNSLIALLLESLMMTMQRIHGGSIEEAICKFRSMNGIGPSNIMEAA